MSQIPAEGSRSLRLEHLANSFAGCSTLQFILGVSNEDDAKAKIFCNIVEDDDQHPRPRVVIRHHGDTSVQIEGYSPIVSTDMLAFVQFDRPDAASLNEHYQLDLSTLNEEDYRRHLDNVMGRITDELTQLSKLAGCFELQMIREFSCGQVDPQTENGEEFFELVWILRGVGE